MNQVKYLAFFLTFFLCFWKKNNHAAPIINKVLETVFLTEFDNSGINSSVLHFDTLKNGGLDELLLIIARDSMRNQIDKNIIHLYRNAKVKYGKFEISADYIRLDNNSRTIFARGIINDAGKYIGRPVLQLPDDTPKSVDSLFYNYATTEGLTYGVMTEEEGTFIQAKVLRKNLYEELSIHSGLYTTCNIPYPHTHFGIRFTKGLVTKNHIIVGPSYLEIMNVPLKFLFIPFGIFPRYNKRSSGFLFPSFGDDASRGFVMRDFGWYLAFNDFWDSELRGSLYSKGSWEASIRTNYLVNYKFNGGFNIRYSVLKSGIERTLSSASNKDFNVTWNHTQRQEANPGTSFSASVNFGTSSYYRNTGFNQANRLEDIISNNMSSSVAYGKVFADGKVNFTASFSHRQEMSTGKLDLELPSFSINVASFQPLGFKKIVKGEKWYQRLTIGYSLQGRNSISTIDSLLFKKETLKKISPAFQHTIPVSFNGNIFRHLQFNTSFNYTERWYFQSTRQRIDNSPAGYRMQTDTILGFKRAYDYSFSAGLSTKVYGMYPKIGKIHSIRHVFTPAINFNYRPDFSTSRYGFYQEYYDQYGIRNIYSIFSQGIFGTPSGGRSASIGFSIDNNIEAKIKRKTKGDIPGDDFKKISILQSLSITGNYNLIADSLKLSIINFSGRTAILGDRLNINFNGTLDPYQTNSNGVRINQFYLKAGKLARLTNFNLSFDYSLNRNVVKSSKEKLDSLRKINEIRSDEMMRNLISSSNSFIDFDIPWNVNGSFSMLYFDFFNTSKHAMESNITAVININGDLNLTPKWKLQINSGYDFIKKTLTITRFNFYRDLHDFDLSIGWTPFGNFKSYNVTIRAKASVLKDLKLSKRNSS